MSVKRIVVGELETNCYIYRDDSTGRCAIVDPGEMNEELRAEIDLAGRDMFDYILLTHCHFDHVGAAGEVKDITRAPIAVYNDDAEGLRDPHINLSGAFAGIRMIYPQADITFKDGDKFKVGNTEFTVMHTPGHTEGSCCYITEGLMFAGDTLFRESVGRTDMPGGSTEKMMRSLKKLMALQGDCLVYTGHYDFTTLSRERASNPYVKMIGEY